MKPMQELVVGYIDAVSRFMLKRGRDPAATNRLRDAINAINGEESLGEIRVNEVDDLRIPDVVALPAFAGISFFNYLMDPDCSQTCPFGYGIEIHERCFRKYSEAELAAVILHDILQNVQSDTAKIRLLNANTAFLARRDLAASAKNLDDMGCWRLAEVYYIAFCHICIRPFRVPIGNDCVGTDAALAAMGLGKAYDAYLAKALPMSNMTVEEAMEREIAQDLKDVSTVLSFGFNERDFRQYLKCVSRGVPLQLLRDVIGNPEEWEDPPSGMEPPPSRRFESNAVTFRPRIPEPEAAVNESHSDLKTELDIRNEIDLIIGNIRYAESEAERSVILHKIMQLRLKISRLSEKISRYDDENSVRMKNRFAEFDRELEELRNKTTNMEIKTKRWSVYVKTDLPDDYNF